MKAVIMAGGEGTRLRPLTSLRPKPMVPIVNRPVMEHIVGLCKWHGIDEIVATLQFMPKVIQDYFGDGEEWGVSIEYAVEDIPMGTAGSVKNAEPLLGDETFVVISGDSLTDIDLTKVVAFHREKGAAVTIALKRVPDPLEFGVVITAEDGRIERFLEKPTWGQVFSDTINTGIYVIDASVLEHVPSKGQFDFSADLFPLLMEKGLPMYGYVAEGYWTDIGSLQSYIQAHWDIMDEKVGLFVPGVKAANQLWIGEGAQIDPEAIIGDKVVIGANTKVRAGARIGDYAIIGDSCLLGFDTRIQHSIVWSDSFIGGGAEVGGAVICRRADVRARARIETGAVIGDETMVGHGAVVGADVAVYPYKRIDPGAVQTTSLIWESKGSRTLFGSDGVSGLIGVDITPELALRLSQAYATTLPAGGHVVASRDQSRGARMVKRAMAAGLNSAGINVRDLRVASSGVNRFTTRDSRCVGGVHVCASSTDPQTTEIHFYDKAGLDLSTGDEKKVERLYFRQEFRRSFFDQMGEIIYPPRALEYYTAGMLDALGLADSRARVRIPEPREARLKVVAEMGHGVASVVAPQVAAGWGIDLIALSPILDAERSAAAADDPERAHAQTIEAVANFRADFGLVIDAAGERVTIVAPDGALLEGDTALHAMVDLYCRSCGCGSIAVPLHASRVIERIAANHGCGVVRCGSSVRAMSLAGLTDDIGFVGDRAGGYMFPTFLAAFDAVATLGMMAKLLVDTGVPLDEIVRGLPEHHLVEAVVACRTDLKGSVMRAMAEATAGMSVEMTEGIRVERDGGWALVLPDSQDPVVTVYAEAADAVGARALLRRYVELVEEVAGERRH
ncbi:MAG: sugar phosphate nucleotidyltransferase [Coriobacteriia bacterium]|nr:sugar phosphate nucleotidyltransferase [Coriobacteriia bacterium]